VALYPGYPGHALAEDRLRAAPNRLAALVPDDARLADVIHVVDFTEGNGGALWLNANCVTQEALCWVEPARAPAGGAAA
jgi:pyruvate,water dikinase